MHGDDTDWIVNTFFFSLYDASTFNTIYMDWLIDFDVIFMLNQTIFRKFIPFIGKPSKNVTIFTHALYRLPFRNFEW